MAALDEMQCNMLVTFYSALSCIYFPVIISTLYFTDFLYSVGTSSFLPVIGVFVVMECVKYVVGNYYLINRNIILGGKHDDRYSKKNKNRAKEFLKSCGILLLSILSFFVLEILFGAEAFDKHEETYMLSLLLCALTIFPTCLNVGSHAIIEVVMGIRPVPDIVGVLLVRNLQFTIFGTWLGAFVIPLDWDRPWQKWPIPCSVGALLGQTASNLLMFVTMVPQIALTRAQSAKSSKRSL